MNVPFNFQWKNWIKFYISHKVSILEYYSVKIRLFLIEVLFNIELIVIVFLFANIQPIIAYTCRFFFIIWQYPFLYRINNLMSNCLRF